MNEIYTDVQHGQHFHVLISVLTASQSNAVTTKGVVKKEEPTNLMPARATKILVQNINRTFNINFSQAFYRLEKSFFTN